MPEDPRVQRLIEEILDSESSAEEVCRDSPELLPRVREGWRRVRALEAQIGALFPEPGAAEAYGATPPEAGLPRVPGYDLSEVLGHGGMGVVYKAFQLRLKRTVALKMMLAGTYAGAPERAWFQREAEAVAALRHENIVQIYEVGALDGPRTSPWSSSRGGAWPDPWRAPPSPAAGRPSCWPRSPGPCSTPTSAASSTET